MTREQRDQEALELWALREPHMLVIWNSFSSEEDRRAAEAEIRRLNEKSRALWAAEVEEPVVEPVVEPAVEAAKADLRYIVSLLGKEGYELHGLADYYQTIGRYDQFAKVASRIEQVDRLRTVLYQNWLCAGLLEHGKATVDQGDKAAPLERSGDRVQSAAGCTCEVEERAT